MKQIKEAFNNHHPVYVKKDTLSGLLISLDLKSIENCKSMGINPIYGSFCVLIADIGKLYDYVTKIPEIAWDIVDYEEKPLIVEYPEGKNLPELAMNNEKKVKIMLLKDHPFSKPLYSYSKPVMWLPLKATEFSSLNLEQFEYVLNLEKNAFDIFHPKKMNLELNGEVKIF